MRSSSKCWYYVTASTSSFPEKYRKHVGTFCTIQQGNPPGSQAWSWATGENTKTERRRRSSVSRMAGGVVEGSKVKPWRSTFFYSIWVMHLKCETTLMEGTLWAWGHKPNFKTVPYDLFCLDSKRKPCSARNADSNFWSDLSGQMQTT